MTETEKYTAKENAKDVLRSALQNYIRVAEEYSFDDSEMAAELEDILLDIDKQWNILTP